MFSLRSCCRLFVLLGLLTVKYMSARAQNNDSVKLGTLYGLVKDTGLNYLLPSATVSVYREGSNSLLAYTLTNALGEYQVTKLPVAVKLKVVVSYIGYASYVGFLQIGSDRLSVNQGVVVLNKAIGEMDSVVVTVPPVRMKGDTLEFNAAAFELDKNAVAEDLLKKLPGVIVWGDGAITVNGRQISKLLVDGKPFFGGDPVVATQNIPKNSIDKIQVYQEPINPFANPFDSITSINIKLRKGSHAGSFGNASAGFGSDDKKDLSLTDFNFTQRDQFALAAQTNNVNKTGGDLNSLMRNNTFKGTGARVEYQPDFSIPGLNRQRSGGLLYTHIFIPDYSPNKTDQLALNSFVNDLRNFTSRNTSTVSFLNGNNSLRQDAVNVLNTHQTKWNSDLGYSWKRKTDSFCVKGNYTYQAADKTGYNSNDISGTTVGLLSHNIQNDSSSNQTHTLGATVNYSHQGFADPEIHKLTNWSFNYSVNGSLGREDRYLQSAIMNVQNAAMDSRYNRKYHITDNDQVHELAVRLGDFGSLLFGRKRALSPFHVQLNSRFSYELQTANRNIADKDSATGNFYQNAFLSGNSRYHQSNEVGGLEISRGFNKLLANRYQKTLELGLYPQVELHQQHFSSNKDFQYFDSHYAGFVPAASVNYTNFQYGDFLDLYSLNYSVRKIYPTADQRTILPDSSDIYLVRFGNNNLRAATNQELSFHFRHERSGARQPFNYGLFLNLGLIKDALADSVSIDAAGRYQYYAVNLGGNRYMGATLFVNKAFTSGARQLQVHVSANGRVARNPGYLNYQGISNQGILISHLFTQSDTIGLNYTYKDVFALNFQEAVELYFAQQTGSSSGKYQSFQTYSRIGAGLNITKKLSLYNNISFNTTKFSGVPQHNYTIWNASLSYRFLKGNNLELKLSALDLLHQNSGVLNYGNSYSYTRGMVNMQQQYFLAGLTFFPRKFGKTKVLK